MKTLLSFKQIDFWLQIILPGCLLLGTRDFIDIYITIGAIQVLSCLLNLFLLKPEYKHNGRYLYNVVLLFIFIISLAVFLPLIWDAGNGDIVYVFLFSMLIIGFVMAIWYLVISYREMQFINKLVKRHELIK
ncbi:MAG: hypothetical protein BGO70_16705 [Bacteroidetes bacterium 43-93]|mgnify:CR=1 FL=1|nr:hypothetical protein [Bacteroidota bacterium]OJX01401.1 MAG: hypothetical protein BGO70_16705 [Bacteroidetes bacterium 43-93]